MPADQLSADEIFAEALRREGSQRASYLDEVYGADTGARDRMERLLQAHHDASSFLEEPAGDMLTSEPYETAMAEQPGAVIGPYTILEQIGEGGFGVVFLAEQERPVRRKVALKIIKPGMDTRAVVVRFEAEKQALALMDHPNIAKVFDAGATENGRPFFVMELVQGVPITDYCDQTNLATRERLELFITVCQAVQHAHQKGVIHRDIKPTNVLVAMQDGRAAPKIIDFGVAKALNQRLTEHSLATGFAQMIGTPLYMSPEQAELSPLGADTRSDIYSLGVMLYELLTGTTPFSKDRLYAASHEELCRIICEEDPPPPSARISTLDAKFATTVADRRRTEPGRLQQTVRGELDWIVMKCLEKDRNRRYESASDLALDVQRHLRDEPVQACPPSTIYRLGKFARRNRRGLAAALAVGMAVLMLIAGLAISNRMIAASRNATADALHQKELALAAAEANAKDADEQRRRAEESSRKALTAVRDLLTSPEISHTEWSQIPAPLRRKFREQAAEFYDSLPQETGNDSALRFERAVGLRALGYLCQQTDGVEQADLLLHQSVEILEALNDESPNNLEYRRQLALSHFTLFQTLWWLRQFDEAAKSVQRAIGLYETLITKPADLSKHASEVFAAYLNAGHLFDEDLDRKSEAERMYRRAIEIHDQDVAHVPFGSFTPADRAKAHEGLAGMKIRAGRLDEAAELYSRATKVAPEVPVIWYRAATLYLATGDVERYRSACRALLNHFEKFDANNAEVADLTAKTCALAPDSVPDFSRVQRIALRCVTNTESHPWRRNFVLNKALADYRSGLHEEAVEWLQKFAPKENGTPVDATAFAALSLANHQLGRTDEAREALAAARKIIANKPADAMKGPPGFDWLHCEILCREAESFTN